MAWLDAKRFGESARLQIRLYQPDRNRQSRGQFEFYGTGAEVLDVKLDDLVT